MEWVRTHSLCYKEEMALPVLEIEQLISPYLTEAGYVLCQIKVTGSPRTPLIQVFIDLKEAYLTVHDCVRATREIQDLLEVCPNVPADYRLEVSSPGITFPLREAWQFRKNIGKMIRWRRLPSLDRSDPNEIDPGSSQKLTGRLTAFTAAGTIMIELEEETEREYQIEELHDARVIIEPSQKKKTKRK